MPQCQKQNRKNHHRAGAIAVLAAALAAGLVPLAAQASVANDVWTGSGGSGNANWSNPSNWNIGDTNPATTGVPATGDSVDFGTSNVLTSNNDISGLSIGELIFGYPAAGPDSFTLNGNALTITPSSYAIYSGAGTGVTETVNNNITISGGSSIREASAGTLVLAGTITGSGDLALNSGSGAIILNDTANGSDTFAGNLTGLSGVVNVEAGNYTVDKGSYALGGTVNLTGGTFTLGSSSTSETQNATSIFNVNGGTLAYNGFYRGAGNTTVNTGGSLTVDASGASGPRISTDGYSGTLTLAGGTATFTGGTITVNEGNAGTTGTTGTINLNAGGTLTTPGLVFDPLNNTANNTAVINSDGGTLIFSNTAPATISASTAATWNVLAGGAIINTDGNNVTIAQALLSDVAGGTDGGLTKGGTGTLDLTGANTYNGNTTVTGGTLEINSSFLATTSTVSIASGALMDLNFTGTNYIASLILGGTSYGPGVYGVGNLDPSYFTGTGTLTVPSVAVPAPATLGLVAIGGLGLLLIGRKRTKRSIM